MMASAAASLWASSSAGWGTDDAGNSKYGRQQRPHRAAGQVPKSREHQTHRILAAPGARLGRTVYTALAIRQIYYSYFQIRIAYRMPARENGAFSPGRELS